MKILFGLVALATIALLSFGFLRENEPETIPTDPLEAIETIISPPEPVPISLSLSTSSIIQGEPARITIDGVTALDTVQELALDGKSLSIYEDDGKLSALVGIDLNKKPGTYPLLLTLRDGRTSEATLEVRERTKVTADFDIPESFGGNTTEGQKELADNWADDTKILNAITAVVSPEKLWGGSFRYPLDGAITITDTYGYNRETGAVNLSHNGTDFRASVGTPVYAMNSGTVVFNERFKNYGTTVIIDHGLGLMTMYMHLSEAIAEKNASVEKGDMIAKSGNTGYSLGPHLHLSVRIGGYSIDPEKFLALMGE